MHTQLREDHTNNGLIKIRIRNKYVCPLNVLYACTHRAKLLEIM
uniref:Uncharacterized protein n=1 Tax=Anguilla anguilla TaxID=7936 RepID=A0A0E9SGK9_ANGAN